MLHYHNDECIINCDCILAMTFGAHLIVEIPCFAYPCWAAVKVCLPFSCSTRQKEISITVDRESSVHG